MTDRRLPPPLFPWVFALIMGGAMTFFVTALLTWTHGGGLRAWLHNWLLA